MKKIAILVAIGVMGTLQSNADYMKWMVDSTAVNNATANPNIQGGNITMAVDGIKNYAYAALVASNSSTHDPWYTAILSTDTVKANYFGDSASTAQVLTRDVVADGAMMVAADIGSDYSSKYFFIELFDAAGKLVGYSEAISGAALNDQLSDYKETSRFAAEWSNLSAWGGGSFTAVPEPTGGLMLLLGAGLIGLRRKKFI